MGENTRLEDLTPRVMGSPDQFHHHRVLSFLAAVEYLKAVTQDLAGGFQDSFTVVARQDLPYLVE